MPDAQKPSRKTLAQMAEELVGVPVAEQRFEAIAGLLSALLAEMGPMRAMHVGSAEPATVYDPDEP